MCTWTTLWLFSLFKKKSAICSCWLYMLGYLSSGLMPFQCRQLLKNKWQMLVTWPPEGRRSLSKMPFQPQMLKKRKKKNPTTAYSFKQRAVACVCRMAVAGKGTILSLLCSVTDSHVVPRLHNEAGWWKRTDVVVSHTASSWQKSPLLELCFNVFCVCVGVCRRGRKGESSRGSLLVSMCRGMCCEDGGVAFVDEVCGRVCPGALREADDLCDNWCLCLPFSPHVCSAWMSV